MQGALTAILQPDSTAHPRPHHAPARAHTLTHARTHTYTHTHTHSHTHAHMYTRAHTYLPPLPSTHQVSGLHGCRTCLCLHPTHGCIFHMYVLSRRPTAGARACSCCSCVCMRACVCLCVCVRVFVTQRASTCTPSPFTCWILTSAQTRLYHLRPISVHN